MSGERMVTRRVDLSSHHGPARFNVAPSAGNPGGAFVVLSIANGAAEILSYASGKQLREIAAAATAVADEIEGGAK